MKVETLLILQENLFDLLLELGDPVSAIGKINSTFILGNITSFALSLFFNRFPMRPSSPAPQGLQPVRHLSKFPPPRVQCVSKEQSR